MSRRAKGTGSVTFCNNRKLWSCREPCKGKRGNQKLIGYAETEKEAHKYLDYYLETGVFYGIPKIIRKNVSESEELSTELEELQIEHEETIAELNKVKVELKETQEEIRVLNIIIEKQKQELGHKKE